MKKWFKRNWELMCILALPLGSVAGALVATVVR
jgi:hypothetical protein